MNTNIENIENIVLEEQAKEPAKDIHPELIKDDDNNILSGDNKIDVGIKPDIKDNVVPIQVCSCSLNLIFNCFTKNTGV